MSFAGSGGRLLNVVRGSDISNGFIRGLAWTSVILAIIVVWCVVVMWYLLFGLLLVPYRVVRRGQRKQSIEERRHAEMLDHLRRPGT
jgi:hypothetical protein